MLNYYFDVQKVYDFQHLPFCIGIFALLFFWGGSTKPCLVGMIWQIVLGLTAHIWIFKLVLYFLPEVHQHLGVDVCFVQMLLACRQNVNTTYDFANLKVKIYTNT